MNRYKSCGSAIQFLSGFLTPFQKLSSLLLLVSPKSISSAWCQKELALATSGAVNRKGMRVLPLRVDNVEMPASLADQLFLDISRDTVQPAVRDLSLTSINFSHKRRISRTRPLKR